MEKLNSRQKAALETREKILDAALKLFSKNGFNGTAVKEISIILNISEGLIYHYFPTKMVLLLAVYERFTLEESDISEVVEILKDSSVQERFKALSVQIYNMLERRKELIYVVFGEALVNPSLAKLVTNIVEKFTRRLAIAIKKLSPNNINEEKTNILTQAYFGSIFQFFIFNENLSAKDKRLDKDEFFNTLVQIYAKGLEIIS